MNKMVINHLEKLFVTNDAATIIRELEVEHPAVKMMILGSQMQEQEVGDASKDRQIAHTQQKDCRCWRGPWNRYQLLGIILLVGTILTVSSSPP